MARASPSLRPVLGSLSGTIAPAGSWAFEAAVAKVGSYNDIWLATKGEIAAHVRQVLVATGTVAAVCSSDFV